MAKKPTAISGTELEVLKVLWEHGAGTVREVDAHLRRNQRRWAYTTVQTLLQRLENKGYVTRDKSEFAHVFSAAVSRDRLLHERLDDLADQLCDGTAVPLMLALVEKQDFSPEDLQRFRGLLDRLEQQSLEQKSSPGQPTAKSSKKRKKRPGK